MSHKLSPRARTAAPAPAHDARAGFTLLEVIVVVMAMLIMAAVVTPNVATRMAEERVERSSALLREIAANIERFEVDVKDYPGTLSQLVDPIDQQDRSSCGKTFSKGHVDKWEGPYVGRLLPPGGIPVGIGLAQDALVRAPDFPASGSSGNPWWMEGGEDDVGSPGDDQEDAGGDAGAMKDAVKGKWKSAEPGTGPGQSNPVLQIEVRGVEEEDARALDRMEDGADGSTGGYVRWGAPDASGLVTLYYAIDVRGC